MGIVSGLFQKIGFTIPSARCFGEPVMGFELDLPLQTSIDILEGCNEQ